jgi:hypothetical protein
MKLVEEGSGPGDVVVGDFSQKLAGKATSREVFQGFPL